jgi:hypothetical protein
MADSPAVDRVHRVDADPSIGRAALALPPTERSGLIGDRERVLVRSLCAGQVKHFAGSERVALAMGVVVIALVANAIDPAFEDAGSRTYPRCSRTPNRSAFCARSGWRRRAHRGHYVPPVLDGG